MVAAVCGTTQREPIVVGKPSTFMMQFLLEKFHISPSRMCMVGDRLDTDILCWTKCWLQNSSSSFRLYRPVYAPRRIKSNPA
ncbi:hypothetical protein QQ045_023687 [Rhodiola kirilowii]